MVKPTFHQEKKKKEGSHKKTHKERYELKLKYKKDYCTCGHITKNNGRCDQHPTLHEFFRKFQRTKKVDSVPSHYESV
jgi:hypothetical protein